MLIETTASAARPIHPQAVPNSREAAAPAEAPGVWLVGDDDCREYDAFVRAHPRAGLFHSLAWRDAVSAARLGRPRHLALISGDGAKGVLPIFEQRDADGRLTWATSASSPPVGALADDSVTRFLLLSRAQHAAESRGVGGVLTDAYFDAATAIDEASAVGATGWLRVPVGRAHRLASGDDGAPSVELAAVDFAALRGRILPPTSTLLARLAADGTVELRAARLEGGDPRGACIWLVDGSRAVVLWHDLPANVATLRRAIRALAWQAGECGAYTLELHVSDGATRAALGREIRGAMIARRGALA